VTQDPDERAADYRHLAEFWVALRRFLRAHEDSAREHGLTPQRYRLLLMITGAPDGRTTVTDLCERLQLAQSTVTELVARCEQAGLVEREGSPHDQRVSFIHVTDEGARRVARVAEAVRPDREQLQALIRNLA
jgi:DNA-binding MarR family transcriptional regulator